MKCRLGLVSIEWRLIFPEIQLIIITRRIDYPRGEKNLDGIDSHYFRYSSPPSLIYSRPNSLPHPTRRPSIFLIRNANARTVHQPWTGIIPRSLDNPWKNDREAMSRPIISTRSQRNGPLNFHGGQKGELVMNHTAVPRE